MKPRISSPQAKIRSLPYDENSDGVNRQTTLLAASLNERSRRRRCVKGASGKRAFAAQPQRSEEAAVMATHPALAGLGIAPRLLTREQAAAYCGVGLTTFTAWIRRGIVPGPVHRTHRWDRKAIDAALDLLGCIDDKLESKALDQWKAKHRARHTERNSPG